MPHGVLGEFLGTAILIVFGNGVVANVLLRRSKAENAGWMVITTGWAFAVMAGVFTAIACGSEGHLNPAVTLGAAVVSGDYSHVAWYTAAQIAGAFLGACIVWLHFLPHWWETPEPDLKRACFCTAPAIRGPLSNLISEIIGTFVLVFVADAILSKAVAKNGPADGLGPYLIGCVVWGIGLSLGGTTGYAINPARDFGPRVAHALLPIAKKEGSDWSYAPIPIIGPMIGGALAGLLAKTLGF
ncbi:MAG TPA: MIP/aquaporin family protein [Bryobacteraceae bacterium]|nr:MIP/aquaporin family protein [Bryobacteraceae bacterium]